MSKNDTLEKFGAEFQTKIISALIQDLSFVEQTFDLISTDYFEADTSKWIVATLLEYFTQYRKLPTPSVFKVELDKVHSEVTKVAVQAHLRNIGKHLADADLAYVKDKFLQFCKNQKLKNAILSSVDLLEQQEYDGIKVLIDDALRAGLPRDVGHNWKKDIDKRLSTSARKTIATPWDCINAITDGGLAAGELGCIAAPSGAGKSWLLAAMGVKCMREGKKVIHFTLELNDNYSGLRYDTIITGIEPKELRNHYDHVKEQVDKIPGEIIIKYFPSYVVNCHRLLSHIQNVKATGFEPDIMVIDYADLLKSNGRSDTRYQEMGNIYVELRSIAGELGIPCWTASQTQRSSITEEIIQADKIADSFQKIMHADFVMSLSRTVDDKQTNTARIHVIKNRLGPDGMTFPVQMNVLKGQIDVFEETSSKGIQLRQAMDGGEDLIKKILHAKFKDHQNGNNSLD